MRGADQIELKVFTINNLLTDKAPNRLNTQYALEMLYFMIHKIRNFELKYSDQRPQYSAFLHDLREESELRWDQKLPKNE